MASITYIDGAWHDGNVPVIGAVEPGARSAMAATARGRIGVIGDFTRRGIREPLTDGPLSQRLYRGICPNNDLVPDTVQYFLDNREAIYAIIDEMTMLSRRSRGDVTKYLDGFFKNISNPKSVNSQFIARCNQTVESLNEKNQ